MSGLLFSSCSTPPLLSCLPNGNKRSKTATFCFHPTIPLLWSPRTYRPHSATVSSQPKCEGKAAPAIRAPPFSLLTLPTPLPLLFQHRALYCRSLQRGSDHRSLPSRPPCTSLQHRHPSLRLQLPSGDCRNWYAPVRLRGSVRRSNARAGLFLRSAFYERRLHVTSGLCQGCLVADVSQRWYAHRSRQNLVVMEVNVTYYGGSASSLPPLLLLLNNTDGGSSADFTVTPVPPPSDIAHACADMTSPPLSSCSLPINTTITIAETKTPEIQGGGVFTVAWAADSVPSTLQVNRSMPLCVFALFYVFL